MGDLRPSERSGEQVADWFNGQSSELKRLAGSGRLLISQPGESDRITLSFQTDGETTRYRFRNRIGVEGGEMLVRPDSIVVLNRIDGVVQIFARNHPGLTPVGALSTLSLIDLFDFRLHAARIAGIMEDETHLEVTLQEGDRLVIDKENGQLRERHRADARAPYKRALFDLYSRFDDSLLPGRVTLYGQDGETRLTLLVRDWSPNPELPPLTLELPPDIRIERP